MSTATMSFQDECRMIIPFRQSGQTFGESFVAEQPDEPLTLIQFYEQSLAETRSCQRSRSTNKADREALNAWAMFTDNIDLRSLIWESPRTSRESLKRLRQQLQMYVRNQLAVPIEASTINKRLRHLRAILNLAADPIDHALIGHVPDLGKDFTGTNSMWQIKSKRLPPRDTISRDEMERLFYATDKTDNPNLWKVIILILWSYGVRTEDHFFRLDWSLIDFTKMLMRFTANKTSKLQGVPLTPLIVRALRSLSTYQPGQQTGPIFGVMNRGTWSRNSGWKEGYYTAWSRDILPAARIEVKKGPAEHKAASLLAEDVRPNLLFHHFRKTMVTDLNIYSGQAGNWVAAHYMGGVSEQFYDTPTERIAMAVQAREDERLPECFKRYFSGSVGDRPQRGDTPQQAEGSPHEDRSLRNE